MNKETLEEFAERLAKAFDIDNYKLIMGLIIAVAKWQAERMYSELIDLLERLTPIYKEDSDLHQKYEKQRLDIIEQFKKK